MLEAVSQDKKTWELDSKFLLQTGHIIESMSKPRDERLRRCGSLSRNIRHIKILTFRGIILYHLVLGREEWNIHESIFFITILTEYDPSAEKEETTESLSTSMINEPISARRLLRSARVLPPFTGLCQSHIQEPSTIRSLMRQFWFFSRWNNLLKREQIGESSFY